jgi:hypothetical protein
MQTGKKELHLISVCDCKQVKKGWLKRKGQWSEFA